jgi:hypothetical protein
MTAGCRVIVGAFGTERSIEIALRFAITRHAWSRKRPAQHIRAGVLVYQERPADNDPAETEQRDANEPAFYHDWLPFHEYAKANG